MAIYWANAVTDDGTRLTTYDGCQTYAEAMQQFVIWQNDYKYKLKEMWIAEYEDGKMVERYEVRAIWSTDMECDSGASA